MSRPISENTKAPAIDVYRERYWDFGPTFFSKQLKEDEQISIHPETARLWLKTAGLWEKKRKRKQHRLRRMRRGRFGELLQMDGSIYGGCLGKSEKQCLMNNNG